MPLVRRALERVRKWAPKRARAPRRPHRHQRHPARRGDDSELFREPGHPHHSLLRRRCPGAGRPKSRNFESLDRLLIRLRRNHPNHFRKRVAVSGDADHSKRPVPLGLLSLLPLARRPGRRVRPRSPRSAGWSAQVARELDRQLTEVARLSIQEFRRTGEVPFRRFQRGTADLAKGGPACACGSRGLLFVDVDGALAPCVAFAPSTFGARPRPLRRVLAALGGLHVTDPDLPAALIRRERHARRLRFLAGSEDRQSPLGQCARCEARPTCSVCPVAIACNRGRVPAFHCDVNRLFGRRRAAFHRQTA